MGLQDNTMTVLTGLVVAGFLGTVLKDDTQGIADLFSSPEVIAANPDSFVLRSGSMVSLDVLANDQLGGSGGTFNVAVLEQPSCGVATPSKNGIDFKSPANCEGKISFSYCLSEGDDCSKAEVSIALRPLKITPSEAPKVASLIEPLSPGNLTKTSLSDFSVFATTFGPEVLKMPGLGESTGLGLSVASNSSLDANSTALFLKDHQLPTEGLIRATSNELPQKEDQGIDPDSIIPTAGQD